MSIVNQILDKYPDALEIFKIKSFDDANYALIQNKNELVLFNLATSQQIRVFNEDYSTKSLIDIGWSISLSFLDLIDYLACAGIVSSEQGSNFRKLEDLTVLIISAKKHLSPSIELAFEWSFAIRGVFHSLWSKLDKKELQNEITIENQLAKDGYIYVIDLDSFVKVGFSCDIKQRMRQYKTSNIKVNLVKKFKGTLNQEKEFHRQFNNGSEKYFDSPEKIVNNLAMFLKSSK